MKMLSESMQGELTCFLGMVLYGFLVAACYHPLVFFRTFVRHSRAVTDAEDILFLSAAGVLFFLAVFYQNDGILRWYTFFGAGAGCFFYVHTLCVPLEHLRKFLQKKKKAYKIKAKNKKGRVSVDEESNPEHRKKDKKKKRS